MAERRQQENPFFLPKPIVMIGLMGAGKSRIGREISIKTGFPFVDADTEISEAAGCSISDIFEMYGEPAFRDLEERVITRLMQGPPQIIATGGGAFMNEKIRNIIIENGVSVWLKADLDTLVERTGRRGGRPILEKGNPRVILQELMEIRYPVYEQADIIIESRDVPIEQTVCETIDAITVHLDALPDIQDDTLAR